MTHPANSLGIADCDTGFQLTQASLTRSMERQQDKIIGKNLQYFITYGALALGAGLLGATLWKRYHR